MDMKLSWWTWDRCSAALAETRGTFPNLARKEKKAWNWYQKEPVSVALLLFVYKVP